MQRDLKTYCFDLDKTICFQKVDKDYYNSYPDMEMVRKINILYEQGHEIIIFTARGMSKFNSDIDRILNAYDEITRKQIKSWGLKFHRLIFGKPSYDFIIDDKAISIEDFKKKNSPNKGFVAGMFDVIHPGYIHMFETVKKNCEYLIVGLHENPKIERDTKSSPILSVDDRKKILESIKYVDEVITYKTEKDLYDILINEKVNVRFLGDDYIDVKFTGCDLKIPIIYIDRSHGWSSTKFKNKIIDGKN